MLVDWESWSRLSFHTSFLGWLDQIRWYVQLCSEEAAVDFGSSFLQLGYLSHLEMGRHVPRSHFQKSTLKLSSMETVEKQSLITF